MYKASSDGGCFQRTSTDIPFQKWQTRYCRPLKFTPDGVNEISPVVVAGRDQECIAAGALISRPRRGILRRSQQGPLLLNSMIHQVIIDGSSGPIILQTMRYREAIERAQ